MKRKPSLFQDASVPEDLSRLEAWLTEKEAAFPTLKTAAAKTVLWADRKNKKKTPVALVYLHGYTATRKEISPSLEKLGSVLGSNVFFTRLTGHGLGSEGHKGIKLASWLQDAREALRVGELLGEKVVLVGTSTGGTLAALMALSRAEKRISAVILISPNFGPKAPLAGLLLWPGKRLFLKLFLGKTTGFKPRNSLETEIWDYRHDTDSLIPMMQSVKLIRSLDFSAWKTPVLLFYSPLDLVVDEKKTVAFFSKVSTSFLETVVADDTGDPEHHVLSGDAKSPGYTDVWVARAADFLKRRLSV